MAYFGSTVGMPIGFALVGPLSDRLGSTATMVVLSAIGVGWALLTASPALGPPASSERH